MNRKLLVVLVLVVILVIVAYRSSGWEFDWPLFFSSLRTIEIKWMLASVMATFVTYLARAVRWQVLLDPVKHVHLEASLMATLIGFCAIYVLGRAGEPIGPIWLSRRERVPLSASAATWVVQRFLDVVMLVVIFAGTLLFLELPATQHAAEMLSVMKRFGSFVLLALAGTTLGLLYFRSNIERIVGFVPFEKLKSALRSVAEGLSFLQRGRSVALTLSHSFVLWILIALQFWFMLIAMGFDFTFAASTFVMVAVAIGSVAAIPGVGGGFQVAMVFCLTTFFAVPTEKSVAAALLAYIFSYIPTITLLAGYMLFTGLSLKDLRGLETT